MPGLNGWQTLEAVRHIRADVPVILCSGYDEAEVMTGDHESFPEVFLAKPYELPALAAAMEKALGGQ